MNPNPRLFPRPFVHNWYILTKIREEVSRFVTAYVTIASPLPRVLDYGSGDAPYSSLFEGKVLEYVTCDIPQNIKAEVHILEDGSVPLPGNSFDIVLSIQVLEHVDDVARYLGEAMRLLRDGGVMFLSTHGQWIYHPIPKDLWRWTREGLVKTVRDAGFSVERVEWCAGPLAYALQLINFSIKWSVEGKYRFLLPCLPLVSFVLNRLMCLADTMTTTRSPENGAIYFLVLRKSSVREKRNQTKNEK